MLRNENVENVDYEKVKVLGRGAFGEAALYRKTEVLYMSVPYNSNNLSLLF